MKNAISPMPSCANALVTSGDGMRKTLQVLNDPSGRMTSVPDTGAMTGLAVRTPGSTCTAKSGWNVAPGP
jgi:hypothetical protein